MGAMGCGTPLPVPLCVENHGQMRTSAHGTQKIPGSENDGRERLRMTLPNSFNAAFDYYIACVVLMVIYIPGDGD